MASIYQLQKRFGTADDWGREEVMYLLYELHTAHRHSIKGSVGDFGLVQEAIAISIIAKEGARTADGMTEIVSKISRVAYAASLIAEAEDFDPETRARLGIADIVCYQQLSLSKVYESVEESMKELPPRNKRRRKLAQVAV